MAHKISWTDTTWNPTRGCSRISPGCVNCYAERIAARFSAGREDHPKRQGPFNGFAIMTDSGASWTGKVELIESKLTEPLRWRKPCRCFVNSMSDLFHDALPDEAIDRVLAITALTPHITYQILTKRSERMRRHILSDDRREMVLGDAWSILGRFPKYDHQNLLKRLWPLPNVHLGVSIEDPERAEQRIPELLRTPAAVRFVSYEPALAAVDFTPWLEGLDWIIIGGESGPGARPFNLEWARSTIRQCKVAGVAVFVKQLGSAPHSDLDRISHRSDPLPRKDGFWKFLKDSKGGNWDEWPEDLRVREFPKVA